MSGDQPSALITDLLVCLRASAGLSQRGLARALAKVSGNPSIDRYYIWRWENGIHTPSPYWRRHLAAVLEVDIDVLDRATAEYELFRAVTGHGNGTANGSDT